MVCSRLVSWTGSSNRKLQDGVFTERSLQLPSLRPCPIFVLHCGARLFFLHRRVCVPSGAARNSCRYLDLLLPGIIYLGLCDVPVDFYMQTSEISGFDPTLCADGCSKALERRTYRSNIETTTAESNLHIMLVD